MKKKTANTNHPTLPKSLEAFLDQLIKDKGFPSSLPKDFFKQTKQELRPMLVKTINLALFAALPTDQQQKFKTAAAKDDFSQQKMQAFFTKHVDNQDMVVTLALIKFKKTYLGLN